jgi:Protein of unknown function (DUF3048) C-terminal domain/Protein of unknown function (DUF3048) N-terminal domain
MPGRPSARWTGRVAAGAAAAAVLAVTACSAVPDPVQPGSGSSPTASSPANPSASSSAQAAGSDRPVAPLTGLPASSQAAATRPAVALLISGAAPQGLGSADLVYQDFASPVRYIALYQSRSATAGPIAPTQPTDRSILPPLHPMVGYDGALSGYFVKLLDKTKVTDAGDGRYPQLYTTTAAGLTTSAQTILHGVSGGTPAPTIFSYRGTGAAGNTLASSGVWTPGSARVTIPGSGTQDWSFSQHTDRWSLTSGGPPVQVANVIIQTVSYKLDVLNAHLGKVVSLAQLTGSGRAEVLSGSAGGHSGGTAASGTWSRLHQGQVFNYFDAKGVPMAFQPGPTWVILAPAGTQVTTAK